MHWVPAYEIIPSLFFFPILYEWGKLPMQLKLWLLCHSCSFSKWWTARLIKILAVTAIKKYNFINKSPSQEKGEKADGLQICKVISISILVHAGSSDLCNKSRTLKTSNRKSAWSTDVLAIQNKMSIFL